MKKIIYIISALCFAITAQAQKPAYNWTFGDFGGLSWNETRSFNVTGLTPAATETSLSKLPTSFKSSISTTEGCFTVSNNNGELLFYSDGVKVYNKIGDIMPNGDGLLGNNSSTQSGIIFPYPENKSRYVAITIGDFNTPNRIGFSVIDMDYDNEKGDIVMPFPATPTNPANMKNIKLTGFKGSMLESVTSILHSNGTDYWILAPGRGNPSYLNAWLFTKNGIVIAPKTSSMGFVTAASNTTGTIKFTADGKHFIWSNTGTKSIYIGDFDNTTGESSNVRKITYTTPNGPYGIEFSPNQKLVYLSGGTLDVYKTDELFSLNDPSMAEKKTYSIATNSTGGVSPQLAIDKRIYLSEFNKNAMFIIDNPNDFDNLKIYKTANNFLAAGSNGKLGLPNFPANYFDMKPKANKFACTGYGYKFSTSVEIAGTNSPVKLLWNFGDGTTTEQNLIPEQSDYEMNHTYDTAGEYNVTITPVNAEETSLESIEITAKAIDCTIKTNRMIRIDLQNLDMLPAQK